MNAGRREPILPAPPGPVSAAERPAGLAIDAPRPSATPSARGQRIALVLSVAAVLWVAANLFAAILLPFVAAAGIAYFLDPPARRLHRAGLPRGLASLLLLVALLSAVLAFVLLVYPVIITQLGLLIGRVPVLIELVRGWAIATIERLQARLGPEFVDTHLRDLVSAQIGSVLGLVTPTLSRVINGGFALVNVVTLLVVTPVVAFYLLRDWPVIIARIDSWLPRRYAGVLRAQAHEVDRILSAWLRGQAICCIVLAAFYAVALSAAGLDFGLTVGLMAGLLSFIPYVGTVSGFVASVGLALAQFPTYGGVAEIAGVFIVGQLLEGYVIYPRFLGDRVELHAVWVIFALFAGGAAFGFAGVLLAVPVTAILGVLARFWMRRYMASPLYLDPPAAPPGAT